MLEKDNAAGRDRTGGLKIFSLALSQLSYRGVNNGLLVSLRNTLTFQDLIVNMILLADDSPPFVSTAILILIVSLVITLG